MRMTTVSAISASNNTLTRTTWTTYVFDSNVMASHLRDARLSASLFSLIKSRSGGHSLRVEANRWLRPKPSREQHFVVIVLCNCKRMKLSDISYLTAIFTASLEVSTFLYLPQAINNHVAQRPKHMYLKYSINVTFRFSQCDKPL